MTKIAMVGSIHVDGEGTLITTEQCLLHENRNSHLSREEIEKNLKNRKTVQLLLMLVLTGRISIPNLALLFLMDITKK